MNDDELIAYLGEHADIKEYHVVVREVKLFLNVGHESFFPSIIIKISRFKNLFFHEISHAVQTPEQIAPYHTSRNGFATEQEALSEAIKATNFYIRIAIKNGHLPSDDWLVPNKDF